MATIIHHPLEKKGWILLNNGYEQTHSPEIIDKIISRITKKRIPVFLAHKKTKLGFSFIFEKKLERLSIDKPKECPEGLDKLRVIFKDEARLAHQFNCPIISSSEDAFFAKLPTVLYRLQRRSSFRVDAPQGSYVSFKANNKLITGIPIKNISASGMLFCCKKDHQLNDSVLDDITLAMPVRESDDLLTDWELKRVERGKVVRFFQNRTSGVTCFGVNFTPQANEEDELVKYVRQRELELLRKGIFI